MFVTKLMDAMGALGEGDTPADEKPKSLADTIKAALASSLGTPLDLFQRLTVGTCSISAVLHTDDHPIVLAVNAHGPLTGLVRS